MGGGVGKFRAQESDIFEVHVNTMGEQKRQQTTSPPVD